MATQIYRTINVHREGTAAWVTIDHAPLNILDATMMLEINAFAGEAALDADLQVIVFQSADPDFFIVHGDMNFVNGPETLMQLDLGDPGTEHLNPMMRFHERIRALPQITIGKLAGLARGGGAEFLSALDMRFAAKGTSSIAQMETPTGIIPGAGGTA
jgi:enoyl-CoA hydratase/carnithine racemase